VFEEKVFFAAAIFELISSVILIPLIIWVIYQVRDNIRRVGKIIFGLLLLRQVIEFYPNLLIIGVFGDQLDLLTISWYLIYGLLTMTLAIQLYFVLEMKRVRIWLESKDPSDLKNELSKYRIFRFFAYLLPLVM
jgi:hypothetical protein